MQIILLIALLTLSSCSLIPHTAPNLKDPELAQQNDIQHNGVVAFAPVYRMNTNANLYMDLRNLDSNLTYRIDLTPGYINSSANFMLGTHTLENEKQVDNLCQGVAFFALPPGQYQTLYAYAYFGDKNKVSGPLTDVKFEVKAHEIASWGQTLIPFEAGIFQATLPTVHTLDTIPVPVFQDCDSLFQNMPIKHWGINTQAE